MLALYPRIVECCSTDARNAISIPAAQRTGGTAAIYGGVGRESNYSWECNGIQWMTTLPGSFHRHRRLDNGPTLQYLVSTPDMTPCGLRLLRGSAPQPTHHQESLTVKTFAVLMLLLAGIPDSWYRPGATIERGKTFKLSLVNN